MDFNLLPKSFFKNNPLEQMSAALIAHFTMTAGFDERIQAKIEEISKPNIASQRWEDIEEERARIAQLDDGEAVVSFIRHGYDIVNRELLCKKILTMQEEVFPLMLRRFRTSFQDGFVETAAYALAHGEQIYIDQLKAMYPEIRNPYAQSMACLVFGVQRQEDTLPLLLAEYERLNEEYPEESFCQGPLLAIYILYDKV